MYMSMIVYLWGCQDLKYKILIKNKKLRPQIKTEDTTGLEESEDEEEDEEDEDQQTKAKFWSPRKAGSKKKVSQSEQIRQSLKNRFQTDIAC